MIFTRTGQTMRVARKLKLPYSVAEEIVENGIENHFPPIRAVAEARKAAKAAKIPPKFESIPPEPSVSLHVAYPPMPTHTGAHKPVHGTAAAADLPAPAPEPPPEILPPPQSGPPNSAIAPLSNDPQQAIAEALNLVHRDLAKALPRESMLIRGYREQAIGIASGAQHLVKAFEAISQSVATRLIQAAQRDEISASRQALANLARLVKIASAATAVGREAIELQRLISGLPQSINASVPGSPTSPMAGTEDVLATLERLAELRKRASAIETTATQYEGEEGGD